MKKVFTFLILLIITNATIAQNFPVQSNVIITPPYSVYLSDYASISSNKLMVSLMLKDINQSDINIKLRVTIKGNGITLRTKQDYQPAPILLQGGTLLQISGPEMEPYLNPANLDFSGISRNEFIKTGKLPEGVYQFTLEALEYRRNVVVSNAGTTIGWLVLNDPPRWTLPMNNSLLTATYPQNIFFSWIPMNTSSPNAAFTTEYEFTIVELWPDNRAPGDAINSYSPIFQTITNNTSLVYGPGEPELTPGRKYVCRLRAYDTEGRDLFKNNGYSEMLVFTFGQACKPPNAYDHQLLGAEEAKVTWTALPGNTQFILSYSEQNSDGTWSNWYQNETIMPWSNLKKLKPEHVYRYQIKAVCGTLESEFSEAKQFTTPAKEEQEIECGKDLSIPDVDKSEPLPTLNPGDKINVGGFSARVVEAEGSNGTFSGKCVTKVTTLGGVRILSEFDGISINQSYQVTEGEINSVKGELNLIDVDAVIDSLTGGKDEEVEEIEENNEANDSSFVLPEEITVVVGGEEIILTGDTTIITADGDTITTNFSNVPPIIMVNGDTTIVNDKIVNIDDGTTGGAAETGSVASGSSTPINTQIGFDLKAKDEVRFGPILLTLDTDPVKSDAEDKCEYTVEEINFDLKFNDINIGEYTAKVDGGKLSYTLDCETGDLQSATITWEKSPGVLVSQIGFIDANASKLELTIDNTGTLSGLINFSTALNEDKNIGSFIVVKKDVEGDFAFSFDNKTDAFDGKFDFNGVKNININLIKQEQILASLENGELSSKGELTSDLTLKQEIAYTENGFNISLNEFDANATYIVGTDSLKFNSISGKASVKDIPGTSGSLDLSFSKKNENVIASIENAEDIKIFGIALSAQKLEAKFNNKFELLEIEGIDIEATYKSDKVNAEGSIEIDKILIAENKLKTLSGKGTIAYPPYAKIDLTDGYYNSETNKILFGANLDLSANESNEINASINQVEISEDGSIKLGEVAIDMATKFGPLTVEFTKAPANSQSITKAEAKVSFSIKKGEINEDLSFVTEVEYKKTDSGLDYIKVDIQDINSDFPDIYGIKNQVNSVSALYKKNDAGVESFEGRVDFTVNLTEDKPIYSDKIILRKGLEGKIGFNLAASDNDGVTGDFDFSSLKGLKVDMVRDSKTIASITGELNKQGLITSDVALTAEISYKEKGFDIGLKSFNANITYKIGTDSLKFNSVSGKASVDKIPGVSASLDMSFAIKEDTLIAAVENAEDIKIFGIDLSAKNLQAQFNNKFELLKIEGKDIEATYKSDKTGAEGQINIKQIVIQDNKLNKLSGSGTLAYAPFAKIDLTDGSYDSETNKIAFAASVDVEANEENSLKTTVSKVEIAEDGSVSIGEVSVDLMATIGPLTIEFVKEPENKKTKIKTANAKVSFSVKDGDVDKRMTIETSVDYRKNKEQGFNYLKVDASELNKEFPPIYGIANTLESVNFFYEKNEDDETSFTGNVSFTANLVEDKQILNKNLVLRKGLKGKIAFELDSEPKDGISGSFDLSALTGLKIDLVKEEKTVAQLTGNFSKKGVITGMFKATEQAEFTTNAFKTTLNKFDVKASYNIEKKQFRFIEGNGKVTVSEITGMEGALAIGLAYKNENFMASLESSENTIKIAGMEIKDLSMAIQIDTLLNLKKFEGGASLKHTLFNSELTVNKLVVENGKITMLDAKGNIEYKKFKFDVTKTVYANQNFTCDAKVLLGESYVAVEKFNIDKDSKVTVGKVKGQIKKSLMSIKFEVAFAEDRFKGSFDATLSKKLSMSGTVDMGTSSCGTCTEGTYPFGYYKLTVGAPIPIFPGISISKLGGEFGFNYYKDFKKKTTYGEPKKGKYLAGLSFGLQDQAGLVEVAVDPAVFAWGNNEAELDITGTVKVPKNNPIIDGRANLNLKIPSYDIYGSVDVDVNIPPSQTGFIKKGGVFNADASMNFEMTKTTKSFAVSNLSANVLNVLKFKGSFENTRYYNESGALTSSSGKLKGNIDFGFDWEYKRKKTLWEVDCRMDFAFNAFLETSFTDQGLTSASFGGSIKSSGNFYVEVFALGSINPYYSLDASAIVKYENQDWYLNSDFVFTAGINDKTWDFDGSISRKLSND